MSHCNTILNQLAALFPRHDFENLASKHHQGDKFLSFNRWSQFLAMMIAQLSGRKSLRDLVGNFAAQGKRIYHLGKKPTSRATLARVNDQQPYDPRRCFIARRVLPSNSSSSKERSIS
jgi:hypothetical protein